MGNLATHKPKITTPEGLAMGKRILLTREERALAGDERFRNLTWFAKECGTDPSTISRYEGGERQPRKADDVILGKAAALLGVRVDWLRYGHGPKGIDGEPETVSDLQHFLSQHVASREIVAEVMKNPRRWPLHVIHQADAMRSKELDGLTPAQRLHHAENVLRQAPSKDPDGVDRLLQKEYGPKDPKPKKRKPKHNKG